MSTEAPQASTLRHRAHRAAAARGHLSDRSCSSAASCPGWTSTTACCSSPRTGAVPLLERVKFSAIYTTNLDEFYMVRVAGLQDQIDAGFETPAPTGARRRRRSRPSARGCSTRAGRQSETSSDELRRRSPSTTSA